MLAPRRFATTSLGARALNAELRRTAQLEQVVMQSSPKDWDAHNCSLALSAFGRQRGGHSSAVNKVLGLVPSTLSSHPKQLSSILFSLAAGGLVSAIPKHLVDQAEEMDLGKSSPGDIANSVWSFAKMRQSPPKFFQRVSRHLVEEEPAKLARFSPQQLANMLWAVSPTCPELLAQVSRGVCSGDVPAHQFNLKDMVTLLTCSARSRDPHRPLFERLAGPISSQLKGASPKDLSSVAWSFALAKVNFPSGLEDELNRHNLKEFTPQQLVHIVHAFAHQGNPLWAANVDKELAARAALLSTREELNLLWALNRLGLDAHRVCARLANRDLQRFTAQDLSNVLPSFVKANHVDRDFCARFADRLGSAKLHELTTNALSRLVWSGAKLSVDLTPQLLGELGKRTDFNARDVSNAMWGFATLKRFEACELFAHRVREFTTDQEASNTLWAFATLGYKDRGFWQRQAGTLCRTELRAFSPQSLSTLLWSFATVGHRSSALGEHFVREVQLCSDAFPLESSTKILWAMGKLGMEAPLLVDRFARELECVELVRLEDISTVLWSFARLRFKCPALCGKLSGRINPQESGDVDALIGVMNAFAVLDYRRNTLCDAVAELALRRKLTVKQLAELLFAFSQLRYGVACPPAAWQQPAAHELASAPAALLSKLAYSLANLNLELGPGVADLVAQEAVRRGAGAFSDRDLAMLMWSFACLDVLGLDSVRAFFNLPMAARARATTTGEHGDGDWGAIVELSRLAWRQVNPDLPRALLDGFPAPAPAAARKPAQPSLVHAQVHHLLQREFGWDDLECEAELPGGSVDLFSPQHRAVIEVDGPHHFLHDNRTPTGKTRFKRAVLARAGYAVHSVHAQDFQHLSAAQQRIKLGEMVQKIRGNR